METTESSKTNLEHPTKEEFFKMIDKLYKLGEDPIPKLQKRDLLKNIQCERDKKKF